MRYRVTLVLGFVFDLLALPVTVELWKELIHYPITELLTESEWSEVLALLVLDSVGALLIMFGIGIAAASLCVDYLSKSFER